MFLLSKQFLGKTQYVILELSYEMRKQGIGPEWFQKGFLLG